MPTHRVDSYFVCGTPRTGSSLLLGGRTAFVYLRRDDVLAQGVSRLRAEQTGTWFVGGSGEIGGDVGNGQALRFDANGIRHYIEEIREHNAAWEAWFASCGIQPHVVHYEDLAEDMAATTRGVLDFLGLDVPEDGCAVIARHQRQADELNRQWIARYRAAVTST